MRTKVGKRKREKHWQSWSLQLYHTSTMLSVMTTEGLLLEFRRAMIITILLPGGLVMDITMLGIAILDTQA